MKKKLFLLEIAMQTVLRLPFQKFFKFGFKNDPLYGNPKSLKATQLIEEINKNNISHVIIHFSDISPLDMSELEKLLNLTHRKNFNSLCLFPLLPKALYKKYKFNYNIKFIDLEFYKTKTLLLKSNTMKSRIFFVI